MNTLLKHAASTRNPPKGFRNLNIASQFIKWNDREGYHYSEHDKAVKEFCKLTGEEYKVW